MRQRNILWLCAASLVAFAASCAVPANNYDPSVDAAIDAATGIEITPSLVTLDEGTSTMVTVRLTAAQPSDVTVDLSATASLGLGVSSVTLGPSALEQQVMVTALDDPDAIDGSATITATGPGVGGATANVTINDDDLMELVTDFNSVTILENTSALVKVHLSAQPQGDVTVNANIGDTTHATVTPSSVVFTPANYGQDQDLSVVGVRDLDATDQATSLDLTSAITPPKSVAVTVQDIDVLRIGAMPTTLTVTEQQPGGQSFGVYLTQQPASDVVVSVTSNNPGVTVNPTSLTFTPANYANAQNVIVNALADNDTTGYGTSITLSATGLTTSVGVTVVDDDIQAIQLAATNPFSVNEGSTATFTARLAYQPAADVVVGVASGSTAVATVSPGALTFSNQDYATPQTVTVTGTPDNDVINGSTTVSLTAAGILTADLPTTVVDDDVLGLVLAGQPATINEGAGASFTVRLNYAPPMPITVGITSSGGAVTVGTPSLNFTAANYATPQTVNLSAPADGNLVSETVNLTVASPGNLTAVVFPVTVNDQTVLAINTSVPSVNVTEQAAAGSFNVTLSTQPLGPVTVNIASSNPDVTATPSTLNFTTSNWNSPQPVSVAALMDDNVASETVTLTLTATGATTAMVTVNVTDNDVQAIVGPASVTVNENGTANVGVHLAFRPSANVIVTAQSLDTSAVSFVPATLTFMPSNYNANQNFVLTGLDDADAVDDSTGLRLTSPGIATPPDVPVTVNDDDTVTIVLANTPTSINEGAMTTFTVRLSAMPAATVTVNLGSNNAAATVGPTPLTFTTANYASPQPVTLTAPVDSNLVSETAMISASSSCCSTQSFNVMVMDQDTLQIQVSQSAVNLTEGGVGAVVAVNLNKQPLGPVTVNLSSNSGLATVSPTPLNFTTSTWATPQNVTISSPTDDNTVGGTATITASATGATSATVTATVTDPDVQAIVEDAANPLAVTEGSTATFHVHLAYRPQASVTVSVASLNTLVATINMPSPPSLTFTTGNWSVDQNVIVAGAQDANMLGDSTTVRLTSSCCTTADVSTSVTDDDNQVIEVNPTSISMNEGTQTTLQVRLRYQPTTNTSVTLSSNSGKVTVPATLNFTTLNYNTYQNATVAAVGDSDTNNESASISLGNSDLINATASVPVSVTDTTVLSTFGWPNMFSSMADVGNGAVLAYQVTITQATTLYKFGIYNKDLNADQWKLALYADSANTPGAKIAEMSSAATLTGVGANEATVSDVAIPAGTYWIAFRSAPLVTMGYSGASPTTRACSRNTTIPSLTTAWPDPFGAATCSTQGILNVYIRTYN